MKPLPLIGMPMSLRGACHLDGQDWLSSLIKIISDTEEAAVISAIGRGWTPCNTFYEIFINRKMEFALNPICFIFFGP